MHENKLASHAPWPPCCAVVRVTASLIPKVQPTGFGEDELPGYVWPLVLFATRQIGKFPLSDLVVLPLTLTAWGQTVRCISHSNRPALNVDI